MTHPRDALSAYLDGELREDERRAVELHLAACPSCAREMEELGALDALARDAAAPEAPAGYFDDLPSRVRARIRAPRRRVSPLWLVPLAAGLMVAVLAPAVLRDNAAREQPARRDRPAALAPAPAATAPEADAAKTLEPAPMPQRAQPTARERKREEAALAKDAPPATVAARDELRARNDAVQAPFAAPPPAAPAAAKEDDRQAMADAAAPAEAELGAAAPAQSRAVAAGGRLSSAAEAKAKKAVADEAFQEAAAIPLDSAASARRARDAWRRYVDAHPARDEARVLLVEAAVAAYRASGDTADRAVAEREADAYLARGDAPGTERVRAARRALQR